MGFDQHDIGWAQFCVTTGYFCGIWPAHNLGARVRAESVCGLGTLLSGAFLVVVGWSGRHRWLLFSALFGFGVAQSVRPGARGSHSPSPSPRLVMTRHAVM
jgi:hypothetical protein